MLLEEPDRDPPRNPLIWRIATGSFLLLVLVFIATTTVGFAESGANQEDLAKERTKNEEQSKENERLRKALEESQTAYLELEAKTEILKQNVTNLLNLTQSLNATVSLQKIEISSLKKKNNYLWIGMGSSLGLALGGIGYSVYETHAASSFKRQLSHLKRELNETERKYAHYSNYFNHSYNWVIAQDLVQLRQGNYQNEVLFDKDSEWSRESLKRAIAEKGTTTTMIMTEKGWIIAGFLKKAWAEDGSYVHDQDALLLSVNRVKNSFIKADKVDKAARLGASPEVMLEFGEAEVVVYENRTGSAVASITYQPENADVSAEEFYAGEPTFNITWMVIYQSVWTPKGVVF